MAWMVRVLQCSWLWTGIVSLLCPRGKGEGCQWFSKQPVWPSAGPSCWPLNRQRTTLWVRMSGYFQSQSGKKQPWPWCWAYRVEAHGGSEGVGAPFSIQQRCVVSKWVCQLCEYPGMWKCWLLPHICNLCKVGDVGRFCSSESPKWVLLFCLCSVSGCLQSTTVSACGSRFSSWSRPLLGWGQIYLLRPISRFGLSTRFLNSSFPY